MRVISTAKTCQAHCHMQAKHRECKSHVSHPPTPACSKDASHLTRRCTVRAGSTAATYTHKHTATLLGTAFAPVCCTALCTVTLHRTQYPRLYHAAHYALHARTQRNPLRRHPTHSATLHDLNHTTLRCAPFMCVHVSTHQPTERVTVRPHTLANFTGHCNV